MVLCQIPWTMENSSGPTADEYINVWCLLNVSLGRRNSRMYHSNSATNPPNGHMVGRCPLHSQSLPDRRFITARTLGRVQLHFIISPCHMSHIWNHHQILHGTALRELKRRHCKLSVQAHPDPSDVTVLFPGTSNCSDGSKTRTAPNDIPRSTKAIPPIQIRTAIGPQWKRCRGQSTSHSLEHFTPLYRTILSETTSPIYAERSPHTER
jgi:hypothetical protein